jgi:hypothetical protein
MHRGFKDGTQGIYSPPYESGWKTYGLGSYSEDELAEREAYDSAWNQGYKHG